MSSHDCTTPSDVHITVTPSSSSSSSLPALEPALSLSVWKRSASYRYDVPRAHDPSVAAAWLRYIGLGMYSDTFATQGVTPATLPSLTSSDMIALGISRLAHRRYLRAELQRQGNAVHRILAVPEHGRIMNHLSVDSNVLTWLRLAVTLLISATLSVALPPSTTATSMQPPDDPPTKFVLASALFMVVVAVAVALYVLATFPAMAAACDRPLAYVADDGNAVAAFPAVLVMLVTAITLYTVLAHRSRVEAALVILSAM